MRDGPEACDGHLYGPRGRLAFLQGRVPGATSPKGPAAQARDVFGGGRSRPATVSVFLRRPSRPNSQLAAEQGLGTAASVSRRGETGFPRARRVFRCGIFPETANDRPQVGQTTAPFRGRGHRDGTVGRRGVSVQSRPSQRSSRQSSAYRSSAGAIPTIAA